MNALSRIHRAVERGGVLLDLHPTVPFGTLEAGGVPLGPLDAREFDGLIEATEAQLAETVRQGLFAPEEEVTFEVVERFDTADELLEKVDGWLGVSVPDALASRVRAGEPPFDVRERVVLRRFRVL